MKLVLVDRNQGMVDAWRAAFDGVQSVDCVHGDLLAIAHTCVVSPANSFGYMHGGIDGAYRAHFGETIEQAVQAEIRRVYGPHLPVGEALLVETGHRGVPALISAPTMFTPQRIDAAQVHLAMQAVVRVAAAHPRRCATVFCPGMGTGVGGVRYKDAAAAMAQAYDTVHAGTP